MTMTATTRQEARAARPAAKALVEGLGGRVVSVGLQKSDDGYEICVTALEPFSDEFERHLRASHHLTVADNIPVTVLRAQTPAYAAAG